MPEAPTGQLPDNRVLQDWAPRSARGSIPLVFVWLLPTIIGLLTTAARVIYLSRSFDIFIDEVTYLRIARAVGFRQRLELAPGQPFLLHPPAWFLIEGAYIRLFDVTGNLMAQIYATRYLVVAFAVITAVLVFLLARRAAGLPAGLIAGLLFALDPFVIKLNSMNMLETSAMTWVLAGFWVILSGRSGALEAEPVRPWRQLLAGCFFGLAIVTKDMMVFLTLLPLVVLVILRWGLPRRAQALIGGSALAVYGLYLVGVALAGQWGSFVQQKTDGVVRFVGLVRSTGFRRAGGPSLIQTLADRLDNYGSSYLLIAVGLVAVYFLLLRRRGSTSREIGVLAVCAYVTLAYNVILGTLEEQFFYYLVVACILASAVVAVQFVSSQATQVSLQRAVGLIAMLLVLATAYNGYEWAGVHLRPDDGYQSVLDYLHENVHRGHPVASTSETGQFVLEGYQSGPWGIWTSPDALAEYAPEYILATPSTLLWNNSEAGKALLAWIDQHGQLEYVFSGREGNELRLYKIPPETWEALQAPSTP
jgi:4-amino-4-deoxy-L-arabinose transferase-like glycosyltransferase